MIKKMLFATVASFFVFQVIAKTTPGKDTINGHPLTFNVDIFDEIKKYIPNPEKRAVYIVKLENNRYFGSSSQGKKDGINYNSTDKTVDLVRGDKTANFAPKGQQVKPGDIVTIAYNQKIVVYVPSVPSLIWIAPRLDGLLVAANPPNTEIPAYAIEALQSPKEIEFTNTVKPSLKSETNIKETAQ